MGSIRSILWHVGHTGTAEDPPGCPGKYFVGFLSSVSCPSRMDIMMSIPVSFVVSDPTADQPSFLRSPGGRVGRGSRRGRGVCGLWSVVCVSVSLCPGKITSYKTLLGKESSITPPWTAVELIWPRCSTVKLAAAEESISRLNLLQGFSRFSGSNSLYS